MTSPPDLPPLLLGNDGELLAYIDALKAEITALRKERDDLRAKLEKAQKVLCNECEIAVREVIGAVRSEEK